MDVSMRSLMVTDVLEEIKPSRRAGCPNKTRDTKHEKIFGFIQAEIASTFQHPPESSDDFNSISNKKVLSSIRVRRCELCAPASGTPLIRSRTASSAPAWAANRISPGRPWSSPCRRLCSVEKSAGEKKIELKQLSAKRFRHKWKSNQGDFHPRPWHSRKR